MDRYLVYRCGRGGLGHTIVSMLNCLRACSENGRIFAADLSRFPYFKERAHENFFANFDFEVPPGVRIETDLERVKEICADPDRFEPPAWGAGNPAAERPERVFIISFEVVSSQLSVGNKFDRGPLRVNLKGPIAARVAPELLPVAADTATVGIYFRSGNGEYLHLRFDSHTVPDYQARYEELIARYADIAQAVAAFIPRRDLRFYVASDSEHFTRALQGSLPNVLSRRQPGIYGSYQDAIAHAGDELEVLADAVVDVWNLMACDYLVYNASLFADLAMLNADSLGPKTTFQIRNRDLANISAAKAPADALAYLETQYWRLYREPNRWDIWLSIKAETMRLRGNAWRRAGDEPAALRCERRAAQLLACARSSEWLAALWGLQGFRDDALALAQAAAAALPGNPDAAAFVAYILEFRGQRAEALAMVRDVLAANPDAADAHLAHIRMLVTAGDLWGAVAAAADGVAGCGPDSWFGEQRESLMRSIVNGQALINVAAQGTARQSSLSRWSWPNDAAGAVNGVKLAAFSFHTAMEEQPWWSVDLGGAELVRRIMVFNRDDMLQEFADTMIIEASDDETAWRELSRNPGRFTGVRGGAPLDLWFNPPVRLRHLRLRLPGHSALHLQQVEVYADRAVPPAVVSG